MLNRRTEKQSEHDGAVYAAQNIYQKNGLKVWINPGSEKNKELGGRYIDVIASERPRFDKAWVTEVETDDSVSESEAKNQWKDYASVYERWHLAVPVSSKSEAEELLRKHRITNCTVITWRHERDGTYTFWGLPGIN